MVRRLPVLPAVMDRRRSGLVLHVSVVDTTQDDLPDISLCCYHDQTPTAIGCVCVLLVGSPLRDKPSNFTIVAVVSSAGSLLLLFLGLAYARFRRMLLW